MTKAQHINALNAISEDLITKVEKKKPFAASIINSWLEKNSLFREIPEGGRKQKTANSIAVFQGLCLLVYFNKARSEYAEITAADFATFLYGIEPRNIRTLMKKGQIASDSEVFGFSIDQID